MTDSLDRAVHAPIDAYRPSMVPPFETVHARKRTRGRRRAAAAVAAVALTVMGIAFVPFMLSGFGGGKEEPAKVASGGDGRAYFDYRVQADDVGAFRDAGGNALTDLQVCHVYPGVSEGARLGGDPTESTGRVAGQRQADAFVACVAAVPGMAATLTPTAPYVEESAPAFIDRRGTPSGNHWWVRTRPAAGDRALDLMVMEDVCASGQPATGRIRPVVEYEADRITVTISVENEGDQACPMNPETPFTLMLDEPVGNRAIYDGRTSPPSPAQQTYVP